MSYEFCLIVTHAFKHSPWVSTTGILMIWYNLNWLQLKLEATHKKKLNFESFELLIIFKSAQSAISAREQIKKAGINRILRFASAS